MQRKWASNLKSAGGVGADERERGIAPIFRKHSHHKPTAKSASLKLRSWNVQPFRVSKNKKIANAFR